MIDRGSLYASESLVIIEGNNLMNIYRIHLSCLYRFLKYPVNIEFKRTEINDMISLASNTIISGCKNTNR